MIDYTFEVVNGDDIKLLIVGLSRNAAEKLFNEYKGSSLDIAHLIECKHTGETIIAYKRGK